MIGALQWSRFSAGWIVATFWILVFGYSTIIVSISAIVAITAEACRPTRSTLPGIVVFIVEVKLASFWVASAVARGTE